MLSGLLSALLALGGTAHASGPLEAAPRLLMAVTPAAGRPKLAVLMVGADPAAAAEVGALARAAQLAVERSGRFELLDLTQVLDPENARARQKRADEAAEAVAAGHKAYDELDTQKALAHFERAAKFLEQTDLPRTFPDLVHAWVMKIASQVANGETRAAELELDRLMPLDPALQLDPNYFSPEFLSRAAKLRTGTPADGTMEVKTTPAGAQVWVDGHYRGLSPLTLKGLTQVDHFVSVIAPGYSLQQQKARPGPVEFGLRRAEYHARYLAAVEQVAHNPQGPLRDGAAVELGKLVGASQVLLGLARKSTTGSRLETVILRIDVATGHNFAFDDPVLSLGERLIEKAVEAFFEALAEDEALRGTPVTHFGSPRGGQKLLGYSLLGAGAALIAGGVLFGLEASTREKEFRQLPQGHERSDGVASSGRTFALLADWFVLLGLGSAGAGAYLAFLMDRGSSGPQPSRASAPPTAHTGPQEVGVPAGDEALKAEPTRAKDDEASRKKDEARRKEDEATRKREEEARRKEDEANRKKEEETRRKDDEASRKKEEARRRDEEANRKKEEARRKDEEATRKKVQEARRKADQAARKRPAADPASPSRSPDTAGAEEERRKAEAEQAKQKEEEERRKAEEAKRKKQEEERRKKALEEDDLRNY